MPYTPIEETLAPYIEEAAAYVRVSSQDQKLHGLSIEAQKQKLTEYAESHNLKIVEWYIDEVTIEDGDTSDIVDAAVFHREDAVETRLTRGWGQI